MQGNKVSITSTKISLDSVNATPPGHFGVDRWRGWVQGIALFSKA